MKIDYIKQIQDVLQKNNSDDFKLKGRSLFENLSPEYKHELSGSFVLVDGNKICESIAGTDICITRKIDGEMRTVFFDGEESFMYTTGGQEEKDFPCLKEISEILKSKGIKNAGIVAELNVISEDAKRTRVTDVIHSLANKSLHNTLCLSPFDILFIDGVKWNVSHYKETYKKMAELFGEYNNQTLIKPVQMEYSTDVNDIQKVYNKWVVKEKAEGLVVHTEQPIIWKVKPQHSIDAVAVGYTVEDNGVRDILFAVMEATGSYRIFAHGGNGLTFEQRKMLQMEFEKRRTDTDYVCTDSRNVAFQMIRPEFVFEITAIDFSSEDCLHEPNMNPLLSYSDDKGFSFIKKSAGVSTYGMKIIRYRNDKHSIYEDVRVEQISDISPFAKDIPSEESLVNLPLSTIVQKIIYTKTTKTKLYVKKFVILKTNKENSGKYPAYLLHISDFSTSRKNLLMKKLYASSSVSQLKQMMAEQIAKSVKAGWVYVK